MHPDRKGQTYPLVTLANLTSVTQKLLEQYGQYPVWLFYGDMGAGKTTLIKTIGTALGVEDTMSSPTFSLINEYRAGGEKRIFHFDFYRILKETEALDLGLEEYFYSGNYCFVEWPEKIPSLIPDTHVAIRIIPDDAEHRTIVTSIHDRKEENGI
jgi:tRNA threonylcarbamoyladenosine biosynthesis protein TsaE